MKAVTTQEQIETIAHHFGKIMEALGLDISASPLADTPRRVAKMYVEELFRGLDPDLFPKMAYFSAPTPEEKGKIVAIRNITFNSMCEHHFVPMNGSVSIAYVPNKKLLGLSKINRLVDYFSRRPQIQERLTTEIANSLSLLLETDDIAVRILAKHHCVTMRGIQDPNSETLTQDLRGKFLSDPALVQQFLAN